MPEPLRPMSTGELLDRSVALYRKHFWLFVGIATVGPAAAVLFQLLTVGSGVFPTAGRKAVSPFAGHGVPLVVGWTIWFAGLAIANAGTVRAVAAVHLDHEISIVGAYRALRGRVWRIVGIFFLASLIAGAVAFLVAVALLIAVGILSVTLSSTKWAFSAGVVIGITAVVAFLAMYVRYALAIPACVVEDFTVRASLKRSVFLSKGSRWRVAAIYLIFLLLAWTVNYGLHFISIKIGVLLHSTIAAATVIYAARFLSGSVTAPLATIGISLLYYDERVRKEAFDLQLMLAGTGPAEAPLAETVPV
jgi:hypothetical protein